MRKELRSCHFTTYRLCWNQSGILSANNVADHTQIYGKNIGNSALENQNDDEESVVAVHTPSPYIVSDLKQMRCTINVVFRLRLPICDVPKARLSQNDRCAEEEKRTIFAYKDVEDEKVKLN